MKNKLFALSLLGVMLLFGINIIQAQKTTIENVTKIKLKSSGSIINSGIVQGYYFFYKLDKVDRKTNAYILEILDQNLEQVSRKKITGPKHYFLVEGAYNGKSIMLKFYDYKGKKFEFRRYDQNSELISKKEMDVNKRYAMIKGTGSDEEIVGENLFSIPNKGFVHILTTKNKKIGYSIDFFPEDGGKSWNYSSDPGSKIIEFGEFLTAEENILLINVMKKKSLTNNKVDYSVIGFDVNTGKKLFETSMNDEKHPGQVINSFIDPVTKQSVVLGMYYKSGGSPYKDKSLGLFSCVIDKSGKIESRNLISWGKDVSKFLPSNKKGKIDGEGFIYFHNMVRSKNGQILAVGEQYRKAASALGIASQLLGGGGSVVKMVVEDTYIFEFNPDFSLNDVQIFEKSKTDVGLPEGSLSLGAHKLALYIKHYEAFDYEYTQKNGDNSLLTVGYVDYEKRKGEKNGVVFGAITYADGKYTTDKIDLETDASRMRVYPAKPGYVMISEYFKKLKKIEARLEKINF